MTKIESEKLFWEVFNCNSEEKLHKLIISNELFQNSNNWYPYGGKSKNDRSNFSTFEGQQPHSGGALVEKITNSIDALLLKRCKQEGIDPKSTNAPNTIEKATEQFFKIPKGDIGELLSGKRAQMARDNIQIIATGRSTDKPDLLIWDNGEGQHPDDFKDTFLSIANNNKTDISFVQGKYNMGSTGAVVFCGEYRYQLIASKKDQQCFDKNGNHSDNVFGWTLVRRHVLTEEEDNAFGSTWYEYFSIDGEKIPQFSIMSLDIGLSDSKQFETGSFIKLYSYEMPKGAKGMINTHLYRELNQLLYKPALPFWLYEKREQHQQAQKLTNAVYGNHVRINGQDKEDGLLEGAAIYEEFQEKQIGTVSVYIAIFQTGDELGQKAERKRSYIGAGRNVVYVLNGQVQETEGQSFITQDLKYNFLKDSMLIVIDYSKVKTSFRQDLFMANRSSLRDNDKSRWLRDKVISILKDNQTLKQLNTERKNKILQGGEDVKEKALIENLLSRVPLDRSLTNLLKKGIDLINLPSKQEKTNKKGKEQNRPRESKRFPSLFNINIKENQQGKKIKSIPLNGKGVIQFDTDVAEDYLYRPQEKGDFQINILQGNQNNEEDNPNPQPDPAPSKVEDFFEVNKSGPLDSSIKLTLKPKETLNVGDEINLNARLTSPDGDMESIFYVKIIDLQREEKKQAHKEPENPELPKLIKISKNKNGEWVQDNKVLWTEENWTAENTIHIFPSGEEGEKVVSAIAINMDSNTLKRYISKSQAKSEKNIEYLKSQYISKVYLHGLFLYSILDKLKNQSSGESQYHKNGDSSEELISKIFMNYSDVLIHLDTNREIMESLSD